MVGQWMRHPFPTLVAGMEPSAMRSLMVLGAMVNKGGQLGGGDDIRLRWGYRSRR